MGLDLDWLEAQVKTPLWCTTAEGVEMFLRTIDELRDTRTRYVAARPLGDTTIRPEGGRVSKIMALVVIEGDGTCEELDERFQRIIGDASEAWLGHQWHAVKVIDGSAIPIRPHSGQADAPEHIDCFPSGAAAPAPKEERE